MPVVKPWVLGHGPGGQVANHLEISDRCLRRWMSTDGVDAGCEEDFTSSERREVVELCRRNWVMEMEILKRASAHLVMDNVVPIR